MRGVAIQLHAFPLEMASRNRAMGETQTLSEHDGKEKNSIPCKELNPWHQGSSQPECYAIQHLTYLYIHKQYCPKCQCISNEHNVIKEFNCSEDSHGATCSRIPWSLVVGTKGSGEIPLPTQGYRTELSCYMVSHDSRLCGMLQEPDIYVTWECGTTSSKRLIGSSTSCYWHWYTALIQYLWTEQTHVHHCPKYVGPRYPHRVTTHVNKDNKIYSGFSQTNNIFLFYFYLYDKFRPTDRHQAIFTGTCSVNSIHVTWDPVRVTNVLKYINNTSSIKWTVLHRVK